MKRLTLLILSIVFALNVNAQIGITDQPEKFKTLKSSEKELPLPSDMQSQKAFEKVSWFHSSAYLIYLIGQLELKGRYITLQPDSCLRGYTDDKPGFTPGLIGLGMTFDPYSESFNQFFTDGFLPSPPKYTYPYRLDSIKTVGVYYIPLGYNSASPDTLRFHVFYMNVYKKTGYAKDYYTTFFTTDEGHDTMYLSPCVKVTGYDKPKGGKIVPAMDSVFTYDYILTPQDTTYTFDSAGTSWFRPNLYKIPMTLDGITPDGVIVPYGAVLGVMIHFVPGYDYELGDTLYHGLSDPLEEGQYADGYPIRVKNHFSLNYYEIEKSTHKVFADPFGYNNPLIAYSYLLYQKYKNTQGNNTFQDSCYFGAFDMLPNISFYISVDTLQGGDDFPQAIIEANDLISNIYPNPTNDKVTIDLKNEGNASIQLFNILGQEVKTINAYNNKVEVNVSDLHSGIYIIRVEQNNKTYTTKIMKQ